MKKLLLTFSLAAMLLSAKAQIIITGAMFDPRGLDAPANNAANPNYAAYSHKGGYEYMQFFRQVSHVYVADIDTDAFFGQHNTNLVAKHVVSPRE